MFSFICGLLLVSLVASSGLRNAPAIMNDFSADFVMQVIDPGNFKDLPLAYTGKMYQDSVGQRVSIINEVFTANQLIKDVTVHLFKQNITISYHESGSSSTCTNVTNDAYFVPYFSSVPQMSFIGNENYEGEIAAVYGITSSNVFSAIYLNNQMVPLRLIAQLQAGGRGSYVYIDFKNVVFGVPADMYFPNSCPSNDSQNHKLTSESDHSSKSMITKSLYLHLNH